MAGDKTRKEVCAMMKLKTSVKPRSSVFICGGRVSGPVFSFIKEVFEL